MMGAYMFELLDKLGQAARHQPSKPFGGITLVMCGDFYQLPPVNKEFIFTSPIFESVFPKDQIVEFTQIKRQTDPKFIQLLQQVRHGDVTPEVVEMLQSRVGATPPSDLITEPMVVHPRNVTVQNHNSSRLNKIDSPAKTFMYTWQPSSDLDEVANRRIHKDLLKSAPMLPTLVLKVGAQVMLTKNMPQLVPRKFNGSMGIVMEFHPKLGCPIVQFDDGSTVLINQNTWKGPKDKGCIIQYPLLLGWAITIYKSQGASFSNMQIGLGPAAARPNLVYTGLSRCRSLEGLYITEFDPDSIIVDEKAKVFYDEYHTYLESKTPKKTQQPQKPIET